MRSYSVDAIVISKKKYGEADSIITIFSLQKGKLKVLAKGVRKITSRKRGALDTFCYARLQIQRGNNLDIISEAQIIDSFSSWKKDLKKVAIAYYLAEIIDRLTQEGQVHEEVFEMLLSTLRTLLNLKNLREEKEKFSKSILVSLGFWRKNLELIGSQKVLENIIERNLYTPRVGKKLLS